MCRSRKIISIPQRGSSEFFRVGGVEGVQKPIVFKQGKHKATVEISEGGSGEFKLKNLWGMDIFRNNTIEYYAKDFQQFLFKVSLCSTYM